jgi:hypothetical protein
MSERVRALVALGEELERVAARTLAEERRGNRRLRRASGRISVLAVIAGLLLLAAAAAAAVLLIEQGAPLPAPHSQDLRSSGIPLPGSARLVGLDASDPDSANPPWDLRLSRTAGGETCTAVGQVLDGQFGIVGLDHVFRALPLGSVDSCGIDSRASPTLIGARTFLGAATGEARTVVSGLAGVGTRAVTVYTAGSARRLRLGPDGSFITVYPGEAEAVQPRVQIVARDGRARSIGLEQGAQSEVPDPAGGSGWVASAEPDLGDGAGLDEACVQVTRQPSQSEASRVTLPLTPEICGHLASSPLFVQMRRFVPGEDATPYPFGDSPSRTIVYGVATPRVRSLSLSGAGAARPVAIDRHGGSFAAILDGHVDPRSLVLTAQLTGGSTAVYRQPSRLYSAIGNRRIAPAPVPAYRSPRPLSATLPPPFQLPIASTVRETLRAPDPAGGPEWVVRSWQGKPNPHVRGVGRKRYHCEQLGVVWNGRLVAPSARPSGYSRSLQSEEGRCNPATDLIRMRYSLSLESFLDDPYAYTPAPARAVLSGMIPPGARDPLLLGVGPTRPLHVDANNAFLVVLPGSDWNATPRITYLLDGHRIGKLRNPPVRLYQPGTEPKVPQVRAADPDGGAPWGFVATRDCSTAVGRIAGRLATIDPTDGVLKPGADFSGHSSSCLVHPTELEPPALEHQPVEFDEQQIGSGQSPFSSEPREVGQPEIERRTLPGRTVISGVARADVVSVTISTPSDVRTLRPVGPQHTILAVYAGYFLRGSIVATVRLRGGSVRTETLNSPAFGSLRTPTLAQSLRDLRRQLPELTARSKRRIRGDVLHSYRRRIAQIERRLAYQRAHPGMLPAE